MKDTIVNVIWNQSGTWGEVGFSGKLYTQKVTLFGLDDDTDYGTELVLEVTEGPEEYIGLVLRPGQEIPGLFAKGFDHPFSGQCYVGNIKVGKTAKEVEQFHMPSVVFAMKPSYLHLPEGTELTDEQKAFLLDAIRFDRKDRFSAGASISKLFTRDEMEGTKKGQIFYA
jgi:hypothetical protein